MAYKHYVRKNEDGSITYIGRHGARPRNAVCEVDESIVGKSLKLIDSEPNGVGEVHKVAVVDEEKESIRLADEAVLEAEEAANEYKLKREEEYPTVGDQLDALYKKHHLDDSTEYDVLAAEIEAVKLKYPKTEE